jgi:hypothetical protein
MADVKYSVPVLIAATGKSWLVPFKTSARR